VLWSSTMQAATRAFLLSAAVSLLFSACATIGSEIPDKPVVEPFSHKGMVLEPASGLRIVIQEDHDAPTAFVHIRVGSGGTADPPGKEGLAHFVEHLAFRNRPGGGKASTWELQNRLGVGRNAFTTADITAYHSVVVKQLLPQLLRIEGWRMANLMSGITPEEFETELEVVRNELRQRYENDAGRAFHALREHLYPESHPMARASVIGSHESLSSITWADAEAFVKKNYAPDNITVIVAGDVDPQAVQQEIARWPRALLEAPTTGPATPRQRWADDARTEPPAPPSTELVKLSVPVPEPQLLVAWTIPGHGRYDQTEVTADFAADAVNMKIFERQLQEGPFADQALGAFVLPGYHASMFVMFASMTPSDDPQKVKQKLLDIAGESIVPTDFERFFKTEGKWNRAVSTLYGSLDMRRAAEEVVDFYAATGRTDYYAHYLNKLSQVQFSEARAFVDKWLKRKRAVAVFLEPEGGSGSAGRATSTKASAEHRLKPSTDIDLSGLQDKQIRQIMFKPGLGDVPRFKLANGLEVFVMSQPANPVATVSIDIPGGDIATNPFGLATLARQLSRTRCSDHGDLRRVGGRRFSDFGSWETSVTTRVLRGNVINAIATTADHVSCREADEVTHLWVGDIMKRQQKRVDRTLKMPLLRAAQESRKRLYGDHQLGQFMIQPQDLAKVPFGTLDAFVRSHYRPDNARVVIMGDATVETVRPLFERYFGAWKRGAGSHSPSPPPPGPQAREIALFDRPGATQTSINLGCRLPPVTQDTHTHYELLEGVIQEELWDLRASWGATYGVGSAVLNHHTHASELTIFGNVENAETAAAVAHMLELVERLGTTGPSIRNFLVKRWDAALAFNRSMSSASVQANRLLWAESVGWGASYWDTVPDRFSQATRQDVRAAIAPCAGREVITLVGDAESLAPRLESAGLSFELQK